MSEPQLGTATQPDDKIKWVTPEEAGEYERMLFKNYVRLDATYKKPAASAKEFFYKIIGLHPSSPANITTTDEQFYIVFEVQKYYRNKTKKALVMDPSSSERREEEQNEPVKRWQQNAKGNWVLVDEDASFMINARQFKQEFTPDNT